MKGVNWKHGYTVGGKKKIYRAWRHMKTRCLNKRNPAYHNYGGRGIQICDKWKNSFTAFLRDVGEPPNASLSIERIDNDGHYEPGNVVWATRKQQANNRRTCVMLTIDGRTQNMKQWATEVGLDKRTVWERLQLGWSAERAIKTPIIKKSVAG